MLRHAMVVLALSSLARADAAPERVPNVSVPGQQPSDTGHALLQSARSLRCTFDTGTAGNLAANPVRLQHERPLPTLEVFDAIDRATHTARYITDAGVVQVQVITGDELLSFFDVNPATGSLEVTSVFPVLRPPPSRRQLLAVSSVHSSGAPGIRMATQDYGACAVLD
jgi:hypothetical protein